MNDPLKENRKGCVGRVLTLSIVSVLFLFFSFPIALVFYGGGGAAIFGMIMIGVLVAIQLPTFMFLKWLDVLPQAKGKGDDR